MQTRNWLSLSRKLIDRLDLNYSFTAVQEAIGEYALAWFGEGVVNTSQYPSPFPVTMSGTALGGSVGFGIGFDQNGQLTNITSTTQGTPDFTLAAASGQPRWDLVCIAYHSVGDTQVPKPSDPLSTIFLNLHDDFSLFVVEGTPSGTPAYPPKGNPLFVVLAGIQVPAGATLGTQCTLDYSVREQANANTVAFPVYRQEVPSGVLNGTNTVFMLSQAPVNAISVLLSVDGVIERIGIDYTLIGQTITFSQAPVLGQDLFAYYVVNSSSSQNPVTAAQEVPSGVSNGTNNTFTLAGKPSSQASTIVFVDGQEVPISEWSLQSGAQSAIIFNVDSIPAPGQDVYVFYFINTFQGGSQPPTTDLTGAVNLGSGQHVLNSVVGGVVQFNTLAAGSNVSIAPSGDTLVISAVGGGSGTGALNVLGTPTPLAITAGGGITATTDQRALQYVTTTGGPVNVTAVPQISGGVTVGQELYLQGTSATNYPILANGNGLSLNGPIDLQNNSGLILVWNGTVWSEISRR